MSRTDRDAPLRVRLNRHEIRARPLHDHRAGLPCDLPEQPPAGWTDGRPSSDTRCRWEWAYDGQQVCGCHTCTGSEEFRAANRRDRHDTKRNLRQGKEDAL